SFLQLRGPRIPEAALIRSSPPPKKLQRLRKCSSNTPPTTPVMEGDSVDNFGSNFQRMLSGCYLWCMADAKQLLSSLNLPASDQATMQERVDQLIRNYRVRGHMAAHLDPLGRNRLAPPELDAEFYGFTDADLSRPFACETMQPGSALTLGQILDRLRETY